MNKLLLIIININLINLEWRHCWKCRWEWRRTNS